MVSWKVCFLEEIPITKAWKTLGWSRAWNWEASRPSLKLAQTSPVWHWLSNLGSLKFLIWNDSDNSKWWNEKISVDLELPWTWDRANSIDLTSHSYLLYHRDTSFRMWTADLRRHGIYGTKLKTLVKIPTTKKSVLHMAARQPSLKWHPVINPLSCTGPHLAAGSRDTHQWVISLWITF